MRAFIVAMTLSVFAFIVSAGEAMANDGFELPEALPRPADSWEEQRGPRDEAERQLIEGIRKKFREGLRRKYEENKFDCDDFAAALFADLYQDGYDVRYYVYQVWLKTGSEAQKRYGETISHAIVAVRMEDGRTVFIEPQSGIQLLDLPEHRIRFIGHNIFEVSVFLEQETRTEQRGEDVCKPCTEASGCMPAPSRSGGGGECLPWCGLEGGKIDCVPGFSCYTGEFDIVEACHDPTSTRAAQDAARANNRQLDITPRPSACEQDGGAVGTGPVTRSGKPLADFFRGSDFPVVNFAARLVRLRARISMPVRAG